MSVWGAILLILFGIGIGTVIGGQWQVIGTLNRIIENYYHKDEDDDWTKLMTDEDD